jgi:succinate dehydrogenase subunit C
LNADADAVPGGARAGERSPREYRWRMPANWWTRKRHYFLYVVREFTALPLAIWLLWLLYAIWRGQPFSTAFAIFSIICLPFALYHSWTFLTLAGTIIHLKVLDRPVSSRLIVASQFALWIGASVVIALLLIWFAK